MVKVEVLLMFFWFGSAFCEDVEPNIQFVLYNNGRSSVSTFKNSITEQGCDPNQNFSIVTHGWLGSTAAWIPDLIGNLSAVRQGCVIFMNYSYYSDRLNYFDTISYFEPISKLMTKKLVQLRDGGADNDKIFMFGFSFGGRIVIEAALNYGTNLVGLIHCKISDFRTTMQ